jgi:hypothetical protein
MASLKLLFQKVLDVFVSLWNPAAYVARVLGFEAHQDRHLQIALLHLRSILSDPLIFANNYGSDSELEILP